MYEYKLYCDYFLWEFLELVYIVPLICIATIILVKIRRDLAKILSLLYLVVLVVLLFVPAYTAELALGFTFGLLVSIALYFGDKRVYVLISVTMAAICLTILMFSYFPCLIQGYGYELMDGKITLYSYPFGKDIIDLKLCNVTLTSDKGWKAMWRIYGYASDDLLMGKFKLHNGKKAIVFLQEDSGKLLVINCSGEYYVIAHQEVEKLYESIQSIR